MEFTAPIPADIAGLIEALRRHRFFAQHPF
jgi:hypothetical protein